MLKNIKAGMGLAIGLSIGFAAVQVMKKEIMKWGAKDDEFMARVKETDPELYEQLKKYR